MNVPAAYSAISVRRLHGPQALFGDNSIKSTVASPSINMPFSSQLVGIGMPCGSSSSIGTLNLESDVCSNAGTRSSICAAEIHNGDRVCESFDRKGRRLASDLAVRSAKGRVAVPLNSRTAPLAREDTGVSASLSADFSRLSKILIPLCSTRATLVTVGAAAPRVLRGSARGGRE
jgi:hypothetical protein